MNSFCNELWYNIVSYLPNIKYFVRFLMINKEFSKLCSTNNASFWISLIKYYCIANNKDFNEICSRLGIYEQGFDLIKYLFSYKKYSNSGCRKTFIEYNNNAHACQYHSGRLKAGGYLSCCHQKGFQTIGCKQSYHNAFFHSMVYLKRLDIKTNDTNIDTNISLYPNNPNKLKTNDTITNSIIHTTECIKFPQINNKNNINNYDQIEIGNKLELLTHDMNIKNVNLPKIV